MNKNKIIGFSFILIMAILGIIAVFFELTSLIIVIVPLVTYVYHAFFVAPKQKQFLNIKEAVKNSTFSNEQLSERTNIEPEKINLLRIECFFTTEELKRLATVLELHEDKSAQKNGKRVLLIVVGFILTLLIVYFVFGENA
ncbi:TPA: hypothetical protein ACOIT4_000547 [Enterococcus faecalis]|uniref:hypothetical protein n=1 Tax=Enterococcus TaxID=1350 RepID=UPI000330C97C|nr:hypothetical protein [Enterococcus faecalis]EGO2675913.1 hypothetical protein [Enterococcus faecalis]EGO2719865.1 hypothetical protein [Enterococcus faecalis]EGO2846441.1 hypothetical protein [Enterococcus faecalis]EGO5117765.1 hypothetical protein [Enterococcus faecalis]EGO5238680.1 hypothetical protein [Enterococcus faecalis]